jgi:hypothetical protein
MEATEHHQELINGVAKEQKQILDKSPMGIYIYLDDTHKVCNKLFSDLLGYKSPAEWAKTEAPLADVIEKDQEKVIEAYEKASEKLTASRLDVSFKNVKSGKTIKTGLLMVPIAFNGHIFVMHFLG